MQIKRGLNFDVCPSPLCTSWDLNPSSRDFLAKILEQDWKHAQYPISAGVPQGSILGPTLFVFYVNDCADHLPGGPSLAVYVDDTTLNKCITCIGDIHVSSTQLQSAVDAVAAWGQSWKIQFELTKSQALTLSCHRPSLVLPPSPISFNNVPVAEENEIRLLGAILDRQLSFRSHLRSITYKANQRMHFFKKVAPLLNMAGKLCLYKGFARPTMEYSILTWMGASESSLKQLDRVQHRVLRLIGPGVVLPHLSHRRMVGALCYMCKLHSIPSSHPYCPVLPWQPQIHAHGGLLSPTIRTSSSTTTLRVLPPGIYGDSPTPPRRHGMWYRHLSCSTGPSSRKCRLLKTKSTATSSIPTGWQPRTVCDCSHAATCSRHYYILLYIFPHSYSLILLVFISFGQFFLLLFPYYFDLFFLYVPCMQAI